MAGICQTMTGTLNLVRTPQMMAKGTPLMAGAPNQWLRQPN